MSMLMNDPMSTMLNPYESHHIPSLYEHPHHHHHHHQQHQKRFLSWKVPKVVKDQKATFESDELFRKLARESEHIIYTPAYMHKKDNKAVDDKLRQKFLAQYKEGCIEIVFTSSGIVLQLNFTPLVVDFQSNTIEPGKPIHIKSNHMILNGVCVRWKGVIDLQTLSGVGCIEFDEENARIEEIVFHEYEQFKKQFQLPPKREHTFKNFSPSGQANIKVE